MSDPLLNVKNIAQPERPLSLDGGPTIAHGDTGLALDSDHTRAQIAAGHLLEIDPEPAPAKAPAKKPTGEKE